MILKTIVSKVVTGAAKVVAPNAPIRPYGMHPLAFGLYLKTGIPVRRIGQTIGNAPASAGTHCKVGEYQGHDYGACFDLHVSDLSHNTVIEDIVTPLALVGFAAFMRVPGSDHWPIGDAYHVHCIYPGANMTEQVSHQVQDWLNESETLNGLAFHVRYGAYQASHEERLSCRVLFKTHVVLSH